VFGATTLLSAADRLPPRATMTGLAVVFGVCTAVQAAPGLPVWAAFAGLLGMGVIGSLGGGVRNGLLKEIVAKEGYLLGRSVLNMSVGVVQIGGFAAGGLLVSVLSPRGTLLAAAGLYLAAAAVARFGLTRRAPRSAGRASVAATWRNNAALWSSVPRRYVLLALWVPNGLIVGCESLYVSYSPSGAGLLFAFGAVGMLAGDTLVGRFVPPHLRRRLGAALRLLLAAPTWCSPCTRRSRCDRRRRRRHRRLLGEPAPAGAPDGPDPGRAGRAGPRPAVGGSAHDAGRGGRPRGNGRPVHLGRHRDDRDGGGVPRRHPRAGPGSAHTRRWRHRIRSSMFGRTRTSMLEEHLTFPAFQDGPGKAVAADDGLVRALSDLGTAGSRDGRISGRPDRGDGRRRHRRPGPVTDGAGHRAARRPERAVRELGLVGALVNGHCAGRYLDEPFFDPILARAAGSGSRSNCTRHTLRRRWPRPPAGG